MLHIYRRLVRGLLFVVHRQHCMSRPRHDICLSAKKQILFYCQAVDCSAQIRRRERDLYARMLAVPSLAATSRLPGWAMVHVGMRVRLTTQVLPPWAVQDAAGTVMELGLSHTDRARLRRDGDVQPFAEVCLNELPHGVYVKLIQCERYLLPPLPCARHKVAGFCEECGESRGFEGWVLVQPMTRI